MPSAGHLHYMEKKEYLHTGRFYFEAGGYIDNLKITYHISEAASNGMDVSGKKTIWICHALTANSDPSDWWSDLTGPGKLFDTEKHIVICANILGSSYGSSGPAAECPRKKDDTSAPFYFFDFPRITVRDIVNAEILLRKHLGISRIYLLVGGSIGGFQALEWSIMEPDVISESVFIACGACATPWMTANNEAQRMAIESDQSFRKAENLKGGEAGLMAARAIALLAYRSYEGYNSTQQEKDSDIIFAERAASYERYQGKKLSDRFDAYSYFYLTYAIDSHNVGRGRGGIEKALSGIKARSTVIGIGSDRLFPPGEQKFMAENIPDAEYHEIRSEFGHDGFLLEHEQIKNIIRQRNIL